MLPLEGATAPDPGTEPTVPLEAAEAAEGSGLRRAGRRVHRQRARRYRRGRTPWTSKRTPPSSVETVSSTTRSNGFTMSLNSTSSPASRDRVSCTIAIERIRRSDSSIACARLRRVEPPALQPQQRRDRLQVVLHPVVDLADRRVLRHEHPVPAAQVGDVAQQDERAGGLASSLSSGITRSSIDDVVPLDLLDHRQRRAHRGVAPRPRRSRSRRGAPATCTRGCPCGAAS